MAYRHRLAAQRLAMGGKASHKGPDFGGVIGESEAKNAGFKTGGKAKRLKTGGIATGAKAPARMDKAPRSAPRVAMARGGSAFSAAQKGSPAPESGSECDSSGQGERGRYRHGGKAKMEHDGDEDGEDDHGRYSYGGYAEGGNPKWIQGAIKHPGALHRSLGVPEGEKIPEKKLEKAAHSDNPTMRRRANLAKTLKGMH